MSRAKAKPADPTPPARNVPPADPGEKPLKLSAVLLYLKDYLRQHGDIQTTFVSSMVHAEVDHEGIATRIVFDMKPPTARNYEDDLDEEGGDGDAD